MKNNKLIYLSPILAIIGFFLLLEAQSLTYWVEANLFPIFSLPAILSGITLLGILCFVVNHFILKKKENKFVKIMHIVNLIVGSLSSLAGLLILAIWLSK